MGDTSLHLACRQKNKDMALVLLSYGASLTERNEKGNSVLDDMPKDWRKDPLIENYITYSKNSKIYQNTNQSIMWQNKESNKNNFVKKYTINNRGCLHFT